VWSRHEVNRTRQRELIAELASLIAEGAPGSLHPVFGAAYLSAGDDAGRLRVIIDQVASLTDTSAFAWHRRLTAS
jgi:dGTPase